MEGTSGATLTVYDEAALCSSTFKILRGMVHTWMNEVSAHKNIFADLQLQHFYRWIHSPSSLLYEPAICRMIHKLMKKMFLQLIGEFRRLGSTIIYADFSKIVVCTKKKSMSDASAYIRFILNSINSRELFHSLTMVPTSCWEYLWWMDQANYGGVRVPMPKSLKVLDEGEEGEEAGQVEEEGEEGSEVMEVGDEGQRSEGMQMNWNIRQYLPQAGSCQELFNYLIAGHILALYKHSLVERQCHTPSSSPVKRRPTHSSSQTQLTPDPSVTVSSVSYAQDRVTKELSEKLFSITQKLHHTLGSGDGGRNKHNTSKVFPSLPGSHLHLNNPALEFIKTVCKVLSLDSSTRHQVATLRRGLLKLIGVREFSLEASYQDPCQSFVLPGVICEYCNNCRDLDLCRDSFIRQEETSDRVHWCCSHCNNFYNHDLIEQGLIDAVQRRSMAFVLQDLVCTKCHGVKESNMAEHCSCAGSFTETLSYDTFIEQMTTFRNIARHYGMDLLDDNVSWILQMNSHSE